MGCSECILLNELPDITCNHTVEWFLYGPVASRMRCRGVSRLEPSTCKSETVD